MVVPVEANFEWTNTLPPKNTIFSGLLMRKFNEVQLGQSAALYCWVLPPGPDLRPQEPDIRAFAKEADYKIGRTEHKKVLASA